MKQYLIISLLFISTLCFSQSAYVLRNMNPAQVQQVSLQSVYSSWRIKTTFGENTKFNFPEINASLLWTLPQIGKLVLPVVGNIGIPLQDSSRSLNLGVHPYVIAKFNERMTFVIHGAARYSVSNEKIDNTAHQDFKVLAGAELSVFTNNGLPFVVSLTPAYIYRNLDRGNSTLLETTMIIPIAQNLAAITEGNFYFKNIKPVFSVGLLVSKIL